ncbi:MAG: fimbrial protein, partial [Xanthomonadales bacterium]|nr:fimbrial protein [Xanthomonadales bacterium]
PVAAGPVGVPLQPHPAATGGDTPGYVADDTEADPATAPAAVSGPVPAPAPAHEGPPPPAPPANTGDER